MIMGALDGGGDGCNVDRFADTAPPAPAVEDVCMAEDDDAALLARSGLTSRR